MAERRVEQAPQAPVDQHEEDQRHEIHRQRIGQVEAEEARLLGDRHAVRAAGHVAPFQRHREHELRERERQHQERDAAGAHAEEADQRRAGRRRADAGRERRARR